jgi:hypothetical protein
MIRLLQRATKYFAPVLVALSLTGSSFLSNPARAQAPPPDPNAPAEGESSSGRPLDGYLGTAVLAGLALFIVGKSARR